MVSDRPTYKANNSRRGKNKETGRRPKQTTVATGRKGRVDERKKGWTRKPENPKKRKRSSVKSYLRSMHLSGIKPHLPNLTYSLYWPRYPSSKAGNSERSKKREREKEKQNAESERETKG